MRAADLPPFATREEVAAWLEQHGLGHVTRLPLEAIGVVSPEWLRVHLKSVGRHHRLLDVASEEAVAKSRAWLDRDGLAEAIPHLVRDFLLRERAEAEAARSEVPARLAEPEPPAARALHAALVALREGFPARLAPRPASALAAAKFRRDADLPGFRYEDPRLAEPFVVKARGFVEPVVELALDGARARARCTCEGDPCVHSLAAIDRALLWLKQPVTAAFSRELEDLTRPAWQRTVEALGRVLDSPAATSPATELAWLLTLTELGQVSVRARLTGKPRGKRDPAVTYPDRRRLLGEHRAVLSAEDARVAALLPDAFEPASWDLLLALVDNPRVALEDDPERPVRVERAVAGLVAERRGTVVRVGAALDGAPLPAQVVARLRERDSRRVPFAWDGSTLTLLEAVPELVAFLDVLAREGELFPEESQPALLEVLSRCSERMPVAMPRSVLGESLPARLTQVLRVHAEATGAIEVELRVRPLEGGPALVPSFGARDVHVRRGEQPFHAARNLDRERDVFERLAAELGLPARAVDERPFAYRFEAEEVDAALHLLRTSESRDPRPELEWVGQEIRVTNAASPRALRVTLERERDWFGVLGGLSVEGERVELARLLDAVRRGARHVRVSEHGYVELTGLLRERLSELADHARVSRRGLEAGPSAIPLLAALEAAGATLEGDAGWRALAERVAQARESTPAVPAAFGAELRPYQLEGYRWMARLAAWGAGGILADDMGLGKTVQALALLAARRGDGPALVVAPTSTLFNWAAEAARFASSLRTVTYGEATDRQATLDTLGPDDVLLASYGLLVRDAAALSAVHFATVVFDEAQNLKNAGTQRARAARALRAQVKFALSGTPVENHSGELWSLFAVVLPGLLGTWESFRARHAVPIDAQLEPGAVASLGRVIGPFMLRRKKAEVETELPPRIDVRVPVVLSPAEWTLYEDVRLATLSDLHTSSGKLREQQRRVEVLAALTRLRLAACHPRLYDARSELPSAKLERLLELVTELAAEGQRALVFSQFTSHLALVREALEERSIPYVYLDGSTPASAREGRVLDFQEGAAPLFLVSTTAGGVGLNLTAATNVIHLDPWWNPAVEDQATDRAHRIGQRRAVTVYRLVSVGTIEEKMLELHDEKRALVEGILSGAAAAGRVTVDELVAMLGAGISPPA